MLFDQSIFPQLANGPSTSEHKTCVPGDRLFPTSEGYRAGAGCYEVHGFIFASLVGFVHVFDSKDPVGYFLNFLKQFF